MFVSHKALNGWHLKTEFFQWGEERKRRRLSEEEARAGFEEAITAYGTPIAPVTSLKYIGRVLLAADNDWPVVVRNLRKARQKWAWLTRVLIREGADAWTSCQIYLTVVQLVLLYGSETWVMKPHIGRVLVRFHHRVERRMTGR